MFQSTAAPFESSPVRGLKLKFPVEALRGSAEISKSRPSRPGAFEPDPRST